MFKEMSLWIREMCWLSATGALYLSLGWLAWEVWSASLTSPRFLLETALPLLPIGLALWIRRRIRRVVPGPVYLCGLQAWAIGQMRHT